MISKSLMVLVTVCLVCGLAVSQTKKDVRSKLFKQVLADYPDVRECVEKEEGGTRTAEEKDRKSTRLNSSHHQVSRMPSSA